MKPVVIIAIAFVFSFTIIPFVYAERDCPEDRICAFPKDFLEYEKITTGWGDTDPIYDKITFGKMADDNFINVLQDDEFTKIETFKVDLRTGFRADEGPLGSLRFIDVIKIPISIGDEIISNDPFIDPPIFEYETTFDYKGQTREAIVAIQDDGDGFNWKLIVDKETGIVLQSIRSSELTSRTLIDTKTLVDTNMITEKPQPQEIVESVQKIPDWVKNSMKWFIDGVISEDEMISALQFLIKEGIIKVD